MTLIVTAPPGCEAERRYILDVVLSDRLGLDWRLLTEERGDVRITLEGTAGPHAIVVPDVLFRPGGPALSTAASLPATPLRGTTVDGVRLPIIYGSPQAEPRAEGADELRLDVDVFGSAFFMLTRYEEGMTAERDGYDRFPAAASLAAREGFLTVPIVDAYVELLWTALSRQWPRLRRRDSAYEVLLTHDVDDPLASLGRRPIGVAAQFAADLLRRRDVALAGRRARSLLTRRDDHALDPHNTFDFLMDVSERSGLRSSFYFQSHEVPDVAAGANYALEHPFVRGLMRRVHDRGHEVGYHAGFGTYLDPRRTAAEFDHLRAVAARAGVEQESWGGRQHYLQWAAPTTWRNWDSAGLSYDCTVAYADAAGFRTGTCHEFRVFDLAARRPLDLRERPFQLMDVTLFGYMALAPAAALEAASRIAAECRRYRGAVGILWHNDSLLRTSREKRWYEALIDAVTATS